MRVNLSVGVVAMTDPDSTSNPDIPVCRLNDDIWPKWLQTIFTYFKCKKPTENLLYNVLSSDPDVLLSLGYLSKSNAY